jgi:hypothetical protein
MTPEDQTTELTVEEQRDGFRLERDAFMDDLEKSERRNARLERENGRLRCIVLALTDAVRIFNRQ